MEFGPLFPFWVLVYTVRALRGTYDSRMKAEVGREGVIDH